MDSSYTSLTAKQKKVYLAIEEFIKLKGIPPTVREIGEMIGEKTPGAVQGILNRLEQKGVIKREIGMARSIRLTMGSSLYDVPTYVPEIKKITQRNINDIYSVYNIKKYLPIFSDMAESNSKLFIIECTEHGLIQQGINYGDLLLVQQDAEIEDKDIVIAVYGNYTLLRQYYSIPNSNSITLKTNIDPFNKETFNNDEIILVGKVISLLRDVR